ncbi:rhodanese-like domain protein [Nonlabens ulvanivorans]|nr:rhodanese-like domain protein [Nonlabens ulvanivorans]
MRHSLLTVLTGGIKYGSQTFSDKVLDSAIADDIKLTVNLVATK